MEKQEGKGLDRRQFLSMGGATLLGATAMGAGLGPSPFAMNPASAGEGEGAISEAINEAVLDVRRPHVVVVKLGTKPVYLPAPGVRDPAVFSFTEALFWSEIMMEHAFFMSMLLPGRELQAQRQEALRFNMSFRRHLKSILTTRIDRGNFRELDRMTINLVQPLRDFKLRLRDSQDSGRIRSLGWSLFYDHIAREAERFTRKLQRLSRGDVAIDQNETMEFWAHIMSEHAEFVAHYLDPREKQLIGQASATGEAFQNLALTPDLHQHMQAAENILDFKVAAEKGILAGQIKSIIHPALADHVVREAVKYKDELRRA